MKAENPQVHEWTGPTGVKFREVREPSGTYYHDTTPRLVIDALEHARENGHRVRLFTGDTNTGKQWFDEYDVCGTVGRSMGPIKTPLLIANSRSTGGGAILTDCIVRLLVNGREVYRHPKYKTPVFSIREIGPDEMPPTDRCYPKHSLRSMGYTHAADIDGKNHANFKSLAKAQRWVEFMQGKRMCK
jgi:hypothetical protein